MKFLLVLVGLLCLGLVHSQPASAAESDVAANIASLIDPTKLSTLGERGANPRIQKAVYWLQAARDSGKKPSAVLDSAIKQGVSSTPGVSRWHWRSFVFTAP